MTKVCTVPPTILAVTLDDARLNMRIDGNDLDPMISLWLKGIIAATEHDIGQCLMEQTWEVRLPRFPDSIALPHPVMDDGIMAVTYIGQDGAERTLLPEAYKLMRGRYQSALVPARGADWPSTSPGVDSVIVEVRCGYGRTPDKTPPNVKLYLLAKLVDQFDPNTRAEKDTAPSPFIARLLDGCRSNV